MRLVALSLLFGLGCSNGAAPTTGSSSFDKRFAELERSAEPGVIQAGGTGMLGEVRRAVTPPPSSMAASSNKEELPDLEVVRVIRSHLPAVKACYDAEERTGSISSGKAILSLSIDSSGNVGQAQVDAPAFRESNLPTCLSNCARGWTFPKVTKGPKSFSYPLVFVGG